VNEPMPGHTRYARNGAADIAFEELGGAGGEPLLLVMGLGVSRFWWPPGLVAELAGQGFHVAAYDQRDAGESTHFPAAGAGSAGPGERPPGTPRGPTRLPVPPSLAWPASRQASSLSPVAAALRRRSVAYTAEDMTDDAVAVLDALGWDSAHLFGHSMGGQLAQRTALRHHPRVRSITSSASLPSDTGGLAAARYVHLGLVARMARLRYPEGRDGDIELGLALARLVASPGYPFDEAEARARIGRDPASGVRDTAAQSRQVGAKWHGGRLSELQVPALVLHGERDPLLRPAAARRTAAAIDGARLVLLPGVGHDLPAAVWPQVAGEVRALADRAAIRTGR
jgi:pimeloyl-ACP methyl ester carboxylesterase